MSIRSTLPKTLKELRLHLCQTSESSKGLRDFIIQYYPIIKSANPDLPILVRETSGVQARAFARFEFGKENKVLLDNLSIKEVESKLSSLVNS